MEQKPRTTSRPTDAPAGERLTEELRDELRDSPSLDTFVEGHDFPERTLSDYLQRLLAERGLVQPAVVREAGLDGGYGYQIFAGIKPHPGRDKVLQIAFAMGLTLREANRALKLAGASPLYPKVRRDAIIAYCLDHGASLQTADAELWRLGEETLSPRG